MTLIPFIDADPNNPPKCPICNDYGGVLDDEKIFWPDGTPYDEVCICQSCPEDED